jgi:hypothetical protein
VRINKKDTFIALIPLRKDISAFSGAKYSYNVKKKIKPE